MTMHKRRRWPFVLGAFVALAVIAVLVFRWDWLIPLVERRASASLGRPVTIQHLHVDLGRTTRIEADGVTVANPPDWPGGGDFATLERLGVDLDVMAYVRDRQVVLPVIDLQSPKVEAERRADGRANWTFPATGGGGGPSAKLGTLRIADGQVHVVAAQPAADFHVRVETQDSQDGTGQIAATAEGTYAEQPIKAEFTGGALLSLRDAAKPYPVNLKVANGPTHVSLVGTVQDPLAFAGADLKLDLAGPDMSLLLPLTGIAIPKTPPYQVAGKLDYAAGSIRFEDFNGKVGHSDLAGTIAVDTKPARPVLTADLRSDRVDLDDLSGFIGGDPDGGRKGKSRARNDGKVLPDDPISLPKLTVADVHLKYRAKRIEGRNQPLDDMRADLDIVDGDVTLHPLSFGIGKGQITGEIALAPEADQIHAKARIDFQRIDLSKLVAATGLAKGAGVIGGQAVVDGTGNSMSGILGHGDGELKLFMGRGGNVSALLVDLSGLQFGNALLSALGIPNRAHLQCMAVDMVLKGGVATARTAILDTDESRVGMKGSVNLRNEKLNLTVETDAKHFSVGSLPTPINITGTFADPGIAPEAGPLALRGGAAVALGIVGTPLAALLPTIQFGTGEDNACAKLLPHAKGPAKAPAEKR